MNPVLPPARPLNIVGPDTAAPTNRSRSLAGTRPKSWFWRIDALALFAFAVAIMSLLGVGLLSYVGAAMVAAFLVAHVLRLGKTIQALWPPPPELLLYTAWVAWVGLTGPMVAVDLDGLLKNYVVLCQMLVMIWTVFAIARSAKFTDIIFYGMLAGGLIQMATVFFGARSEAEPIMDPAGRQTGTTTNANGLGILMVLTTVAAFWFWNKAGSWRRLRKLLILAVIPAAVYVMLSSGSRKAAAAMLVLVLAWTLFGAFPIRGLRNLFASLTAGAVLIVAFMTLLPQLEENTPVGRRYAEFFETGRGDVGEAVESNSRYELYSVGLAMFIDNPVFGVGLNNFQRHYAGGLYSHSDYIEPLATTGLPGFLLYESFYALLIVRCWALLRTVHDTATRYRIKLMLMALLSILIIGVGAPMYTNQSVFLLLTGFSEISWRFKKEEERRLAAEANR